MSFADYGRRLAASAPPITDAQAMETARILLSDGRAS
jgi:hypothetical protein